MIHRIAHFATFAMKGMTLAVDHPMVGFGDDARSERRVDPFASLRLKVGMTNDS